MRYVDTNVILRYILNDHEELSPAAKLIVDGGDIFVTTEVLAEAVYVLMVVYDVERKDVRESLRAFINDSNCGLSRRDVVEKSFDLYESTSLDYVDCVLAAYAIVSGVDVATFDKKLRKLIAESSRDDAPTPAQ
jgi:predicted nucleic-acid-binding protein